MNFESIKSEVNFKPINKSVFYKCNACKGSVDITELRRHAEGHNPVFKFFEWHQVLELYRLDF